MRTADQGELDRILEDGPETKMSQWRTFFKSAQANLHHVKLLWQIFGLKLGQKLES